MCGLAGFWSSKNEAHDRAAVLRRMTDALRHRGPDDEGQWIDVTAGIALGHRRLAVLELSSAGHQPMVSRSGRYVVAFNGEIYNHADLRRLLPGASWRGHSDTETLLAAIEEWGLQRALRASVGMFALALWDCTTRTLCLARDRLGEKPLYFGRLGPTLLFASELKALRAHPEFRAEVDIDALRDYVGHGYVRAPRSIYQGNPQGFARHDRARARRCERAHNERGLLGSRVDRCGTREADVRRFSLRRGRRARDPG